MLRDRGTIVVCGIDAAPLALDLTRLVRRKHVLRGTQRAPRATWRRALRLLAEQPSRLRGVISHRLPLSQAIEALDLARSRGASKIMLDPRARDGKGTAGMVVDVEHHGSVSLIAINCPAAGNAIDDEVVVGLRDAFDAFDRSEQRAALLTGRGATFSQGSEAGLTVTGLWRCMPGIGVTTEKPIIAAVSGEARGSAFSLAMLSDLCVAAADAQFRYPEAIHGATGGLVAGLACRIPHKVAMEIMLLGKPISAIRAYEVGLVNRLAETGAHVEAALELAEELASRAPLVQQLLKRLVAQTLPRGPSEILAQTLRDVTAVRDSQDSAEGKLATAEGRAPRFAGR